MFPLDNIMDELKTLQVEHEGNQVASEHLRTQQDKLTERMDSLSERLQEIRAKDYGLARYYREQWCAMFMYAGALEEILRRLEIPLPCPPDDNGSLEAAFEDRDPPTLAGLCARWNMERAREEISDTSKSTMTNGTGRVATPEDGLAPPARKRHRS